MTTAAPAIDRRPRRHSSLHAERDRKLRLAIERYAGPEGVCFAHLHDLAFIAGMDAIDAQASMQRLVASGFATLRDSPVGDRQWIVIAQHTPRPTSSFSPPARRPAASLCKAGDGGSFVQREGAPA